MQEGNIEDLIIEDTVEKVVEETNSIDDLIIIEPLEETVEDAKLVSEDISLDSQPDTEALTEDQIKRFNKGEFLTAEKDLFNEYVKPENKESRKKKLADETFQQLENYIKDIPVESIEKELANDYFKVPDLEEMKSRFEQGEFLMSEKEAMAAWGETGDIPLDIYISDPEKQEQYKSYIKSGVLEPYSDQNEAELYSLRKQSKNNLYKKEAELYLRNVPEDVQDLMLPFGSNKEYKTSEEAVKVLEVTRQALVDNSNQIKKDYSSYLEEAKPYNDRIKEIKKEIGDIESTIKSGNINDGSPEAKEAYLGLLNEAELIQEDYTKKGIDKLYNNIVKFQELNNLNIKAFEEKAENVETKSILEKAIGLDYTLSARAGMAMEEFFVGGALNFGSLTSQVLLKAAGASRGSTKLLQPYIDVIKESTVNYNKKLAEKRETTIPEAISLDDIENENIDFFDWFGESLANNSPSIVTTFIPGGAVLKGSSLVRAAAAKGISKKAALQAQQRLIKQGTRTAQAIFFTGESGGRYGDLEVQQSNALERLPMLKKQIEEELNTDKKIELKEEYEDLKRISDYSFAQKAFTSYAYGGIATAAETLGSLKLITGGNKLAKEIGKQNFKAGVYGSKLNFAANITGKTISGISKSAGKAIAIEELEEGLTLIGHNLVDIAVLGENKSVIEGLNKDFLANTAVTSFAIMAPKTMGNTRNMLKSEFAIREDLKETEKKTLELIQLQEQFSALDPGVERDELRNRRRQLLNELALDDAMSLNNLNYLTNEQIVEVSDINRQMRQFQNQMIELGKTGDLSEGGRQARKRIQDQYTSLDDKRTDLLNTKKLKIREDKKKIAEILGGNFVNLRAEYYFGLNDFYSDVAMTLMPKDGKYIAVETSENGDITTDLSELSKEEVEAVNNFVASGQNATVFGNNILINNTIVKKQIGQSEYFGDAGYAAAAPIEELFHLQNKAKNIVDKDGLLSEEATKAVDEAIEFIGNKKELGLISEEDYNDLIKRFELYKTGGKGKVILKSGKRGNATVDAEELLAQMNNAVALGALTLDDVDNMPSLKGFINDLGKDIFGDSSWMFDLKTSDDVFKFIKNYQSNIQEKVSLALPDDEDETVEKFSKIEDNKDIKEIFDEFTGSAENRKFKSKEEFKGIPKLNEKGKVVYDGKGEIVYSKKPAKEFFAALKEIEQSETLDASIRNIVGKSYLDMNPGFVKEVKEKISDKFKSEYDASKNSLFGWLTGKNISGQPLINRAAGDIQIKRGKKPSTVSADQKIGGEESRVTIGETLVSDEISPEDYTDMMLVQDKLKKIKPQQSKIAKKIDLTKNELNLVKRDITNFLRKSDRPAMTDPKKFFKAFVDYMSTATGNRLYDKLSGTKDGLLSTKNRKAFIESIAEDLIALNKVDPSVMRRSNWTPFYELEIKRMSPTQTQKAIDEGRIPSTTNLNAGNDLFRTLDPSVDQVVDYLMGIRPDVLKRKMPKFLAEVIAKNEFNDIVDNPKQPVYDTKGDLTDRTIDLSESITEKEITRGAPQVKEKIARPAGVKFSKTSINNAARLFLAKNNIKEFKFNFEGKEFIYDVNKGYLKNTDNTAVKYYQYVTQEILPKYLPISNLVNSNNYASRSDKFGRGHFMTGKQRANVVKEGLKNEKKFTEKQRNIVKETVSQKAFTTTKKGKKQLVNFGSKEYLQKTTNNYDGLEYTLFQLQEMVKDYPETSFYVAGLFNSASGNSGHFIRQSAMPRGVDQGFIDAGFKGEKEHIWQQNQAAEMMFEDIINGTVKENFKFIRDNYFMLGISNSNNNKLKDLSGRYGEKYNYGNLPPSIFIESLVEALKTNNFSKAISIWVRYFNSNVNGNNGGMNPNSLTFDGKTVSELFNVAVEAKYKNNPDVIAFQNSLIENQIVNGLDPKAAKELLNEYLKLVPQKTKAGKFSKSVLSESKVLNLEGDLSMQELLGKAASIDQALSISRDINAPVKKIRVFDFDDTLATTKSNVLFTAPNGTEGSLTAEKFAMDGARLLEEGYSFDFTEFDKVTKGKPGPLLDLAKKIQDARGTEDVFVLTARAPQAAIAIKEFLKSQGLDIPLKNITGLGKSTGEAKANWMIDKAAEGYNDFYFADDAKSNVKAVRDVLEVIDVKSKVQQAKFSKSKDLSSDFNKLIEESTGIGAEKVFSDVKAKLRGGDKKGQRFFIPPSAEDMLGLVYTTLGKGKKGEAHMKFYQENLFDPYTRAMDNLSTDRVNLMADFKALKKELNVPKDLQKTTESGFTNEQAVRVYLWNKAGEQIPGLSKADLKELSDIVENNPKLKVFADQIMSITKGDGYSKPKDAWALGTITTDLIDILNTTKRGKYLESWNQNVDLIYSKDNLNKLEAAYGKKYRDAVEDSLRRMKSGSNRLAGGNKLSNDVLDYINNSTAVTMFINARSALLQTISAANFINWSFNNPLKAGKAFANQPQFWKDFTMLMNSDYLVDRRNGLKLNINESEIANAAKTSKNKAKAALNYILEKGYLPTKYADSFAIASGGATFYRNRVNDLIKNEGLTKSEAEVRAMKEFRAESEKSQQSSDPSKISSQQASYLGRIILQYVNTPMQYARLQKRDIQDMVNRRSMPGKTLAQSNRIRLSRIAYYAFIQNLIFNALQQAVFAIGFSDDDMDEKDEKKLLKTANGMIDSSLRGLGLGGVTIQVLKNLGIDIYDRSKRDRPEYTDSYKKLLEFSPAIKSKLGKFQSAAYPFDNKKRRAEVFEKGFSLDNPAYESMAKVITATTNVPLDRLFSKVNNLKAAAAEDTEAWQSVAMVLGWPEWQIKGKQNYVKASSKRKNKSSFRGSSFSGSSF
tara:strand:- start:60 stop:8507 length:8448 start_codon:yes stop_codon:yes gene_type:complete